MGEHEHEDDEYDDEDEVESSGEEGSTSTTGDEGSGRTTSGKIFTGRSQLSTDSDGSSGEGSDESEYYDDNDEDNKDDDEDADWDSLSDEEETGSAKEAPDYDAETEDDRSGGSGHGAKDEFWNSRGRGRMEKRSQSRGMNNAPTLAPSPMTVGPPPTVFEDSFWGQQDSGSNLEASKSYDELYGPHGEHEI